MKAIKNPDYFIKLTPQPKGSEILSAMQNKHEQDKEYLRGLFIGINVFLSSIIIICLDIYISNLLGTLFY